MFASGQLVSSYDIPYQDGHMVYAGSTNHFVLTLSKTSATAGLLTIYINGNQGYTNSFTQTLWPDVDRNNSAVGRRSTSMAVGNSGGYFPGSLAEVAVYGYALSAAQVAAHYAAGQAAAPNPPPPPSPPPPPPPPRSPLPASCAASAGYAATVLADLPWGYW